MLSEPDIIKRGVSTLWDFIEVQCERQRSQHTCNEEDDIEECDEERSARKEELGRPRTPEASFIYRLDGNDIRFRLNKDVGFDEASRNENIHRIVEVAKLSADAGAITLSAYRADKEAARELHAKAGVS